MCYNLYYVATNALNYHAVFSLHFCLCTCYLFFLCTRTASSLSYPYDTLLVSFKTNSSLTRLEQINFSFFMWVLHLYIFYLDMIQYCYYLLPFYLQHLAHYLGLILEKNVFDKLTWILTKENSLCFVLCDNIACIFHHPQVNYNGL